MVGKQAERTEYGDGVFVWTVSLTEPQWQLPLNFNSTGILWEEDKRIENSRTGVK